MVCRFTYPTTSAAKYLKQMSVNSTFQGGGGGGERKKKKDQNILKKWHQKKKQ